MKRLVRARSIMTLAPSVQSRVINFTQISRKILLLYLTMCKLSSIIAIKEMEANNKIPRKTHLKEEIY